MKGRGKFIWLKYHFFIKMKSNGFVIICTGNSCLDVKLSEPETYLHTVSRLRLRELYINLHEIWAPYGDEDVDAGRLCCNVVWTLRYIP
jgi:hypothetical protein